MPETIASTAPILDRDSFVPLYHQLYELLRQQIDAGEWQPGEQLPTEAELAAMYDISQITIRKALNMLVDAGQIYRHQGKGTFVAQQPLTSSLGQLVSIDEDLRQRGIAYRVEVMEAKTAPVSKATAQQLQVEIGEELACIERLFTVKNEPICVERLYVVHRYCAGILDLNLVDDALNTILAKKYGLLAAKAEQTIRARKADSEFARLFQIAPEDPLLFVERVVYSHRNVPFLFGRVFYRGDRYALKLQVT